MVLRMEPPEAIVETSRLREFEILGVAGDVVPVPPCYWVDAEGAYLPHPALIYGFAAGTTKPAARPSTQFTGIGTNCGPELRQILAEQFVDHLAAIHTIDPARSSVTTGLAVSTSTRRISEPVTVTASSVLALPASGLV